jgi:hypothetical protein
VVAREYFVNLDGTIDEFCMDGNIWDFTILRASPNTAMNEVMPMIVRFRSPNFRFNWPKYDAGLNRKSNLETWVTNPSMVRSHAYWYSPFVKCGWQFETLCASRKSCQGLWDDRYRSQTSPEPVCCEGLFTCHRPSGQMLWSLNCPPKPIPLFREPGNILWNPIKFDWI